MPEDIIKSEFNEASFRMRRIDECKRLINLLWTNPLTYQPEYNKYGYEVIFSNLLNLITIVWGKLKTPEREKIEKYRDTILDYMELKQIFIITNHEGYGSQKQTTSVDRKNWKILRRMLFNLELELEELFETHELSTPNQETEGGWD